MGKRYIGRQIAILILVGVSWCPIPCSAGSAIEILGDISFYIPDEAWECVNDFQSDSKYKVIRRINPFYLRADINGDHKLDYLILVRRISDNKEGILVCSDKPEILFAGNAINDIGGEGMDDLNRVDYWHVYNSPLGEGFENMPPPPEAIGEVILIGRTETWSQALYMTSKGFITYQLGD